MGRLRQCVVLSLPSYSLYHAMLLLLEGGRKRRLLLEGRCQTARSAYAGGVVMPVL